MGNHVILVAVIFCVIPEQAICLATVFFSLFCYIRNPIQCQLVAAFTYSNPTKSVAYVISFLQL